MFRFIYECVSNIPILFLKVRWKYGPKRKEGPETGFAPDTWSASLNRDIRTRLLDHFWFEMGNKFPDVPWSVPKEEVFSDPHSFRDKLRISVNHNGKEYTAFFELDAS